VTHLIYIHEVLSLVYVTSSYTSYAFYFIFQNSNVGQKTTIAVKTRHRSADRRVLLSIYL